MRALPTTLVKAQQSTSVKALTKLVLTSGSTTYTYTKENILDYKKTEDGPLQSLEITLNNADQSLTDIDFRAYEGVLSNGAVTTRGEEYSACAPMTVISQQFNSDPKKLECTLYLEGICNLMQSDQACETYQPDSDNTDSIRDLIDAIAGATLDAFSHCTEYTTVWEYGYDDLADTYQPKDDFRVYVGNNRLSKINQLLDLTKNVMVPKADGKLHIFKPVTSGSSYDYQYSLEDSDIPHPFFAKALRNTLVIPNYVQVHSRCDDDPIYTGTATDATSFALLRKYAFKEARLDSNDQAESIAEAILVKAQMWCEAGAVDVPMNVGAEVYDYVKVTDEREDDYRIGNIGKLVRHFNLRKNEWRLSFTFGNWQNARKALGELGITADDLENSFSRLRVGDLYAEHILADNIDLVWIDSDGNIDLSQIGDTLDNLPDGETYARTRSLHLDASGVYLQEDTLYSLRIPGQADKDLTKGITAPTSKETGDVWIDTNYTPNKVMMWSGAAWVELTEEQLAEFNRGATFRRVKKAALTSGGLILLDEVQVGTYGLVKTTSISAGGLVLMDEIEDGTYGKLRVTQLDSGYLLLTSQSAYDGEWYDEAGVEIDADDGIRLFGGAVMRIYNDAAYYRGCIGAEGTDYTLVGLNANIMLDADLEIRFSSDSRVVRPGGANMEYLGTSTYYWARVYSANYYYKNLPQSFQVHDDIGLLRGIKHKDGFLDIDTFPAELVESDEELEAAKQDALNKLDNDGKEIKRMREAVKNKRKEINADKSLNKRGKDKALKEMDRRDADIDAIEKKHNDRKPEILQSIEEASRVRGINVPAWQSLMTGALVQLADRMDAIEASINP